VSSRATQGGIVNPDTTLRHRATAAERIENTFKGAEDFPLKMAPAKARIWP